MTTTKVATLYMLLGGDEPVSLTSIESALATTLTTDFKAFSHGVAEYTAPSWTRTYDEEGNLLGYNVVGGALGGIAAQAPYSYLTGFVWILFARDPALDLGGARTRILGEPRQVLRDGGAQELQISLVNYGSTPSGYRNWPAMPPLPTVGTPAPATSSRGGFPWWVLFPIAAALQNVR